MFGDLFDSFEKQLDGLLSDLCPGWQVPPNPGTTADNERYRAYRRRNAKRMKLSTMLRERPQDAVAVASRVLDAIVCDEDGGLIRKLIEPVLVAVGRRSVQEHLISVVASGSGLQKVCAVRAWYWSQPVLAYRSTGAYEEKRPTAESRSSIDEVADLRVRYREACLVAFVNCDHVPTREVLAGGVILNEACYAPTFQEKVAQAQAIAEADPVRYRTLLAHAEDHDTSLVSIGLDKADGDLMRTAVDIVTVLMEGGPATDISHYVDGAKAVEFFLSHLRDWPSQTRDVLLVAAVRDYLGRERADEDWPAGWSPRVRRALSAACAEMLNDPRWAKLAREDLESADARVLDRAERACRALGIDTHTGRVRVPPDSSPEVH